MATSVLSQTLHSLTHTKIRELEKQRTRHEARKAAILASAAAAPDQHERVARLYRGVTELYPENRTASNGGPPYRGGARGRGGRGGRARGGRAALRGGRGSLTAGVSRDVDNIATWLEQARWDASVTTELLDRYEAMLRRALEVQSRRLGLAGLHTQLVMEWSGGQARSSSSSEEKGAEGEAGSFEVVDRQKERLKALCDQFEAVVFEPLETNADDIIAYMADLFQGEDGEKTLESIQEQIGEGSEKIAEHVAPFNKGNLKLTIKGLLAEDLLSDEKQSLLRDLQENDLALREIADVLNMRIADLDNWEWEAGEDGIPVLPRQQLNGKYRIWMDEDVVQAILIHYIGIQCCKFTRGALSHFIQLESDGIWKWKPHEMSRTDSERRRYYLGDAARPSEDCIDSQRRREYIEHFFLSQMPRDEHSLLGAYDDEEQYDGEGGGDEDSVWGSGEASQKQPTNTKQKLLRVLASDAIVHRSLKGEVAMLQSDLQWYGTGLSHTTIFTVLRFFGFSETLLEFLRKVLQAPLNMQRSDPDEEKNNEQRKGPRTRLRGVPMAHAIEKLIGELILFVMDLAVSQKTGMLLYRLHDDVWLCGEPTYVATAWQTMQDFARIFGLEFNPAKTGSVYITDTPSRKEITDILPKGPVRVGHLVLDPTSGSWQIDTGRVAQHVAQLKQQLAVCQTSVLAWIRTWNSCIGRFFSHSFGEPARCFGAAHVDSVLATYRAMQAELFGSPSIGVVQYLQKMLRERFGAEDVPDAFIVLPEELGGLGVRNPFIPALAVRGPVGRFGTPAEIMEAFVRSEDAQYTECQKEFEKMDQVQRVRAFVSKWESFGYNDSDEADNALSSLLNTEELGMFMSREDFGRWRETTSFDLANTYKTLQSAPAEDEWGTEEPKLDAEVIEAFRTAGLSHSVTGNGPKAVEVRWNSQMYYGKLRDELGGLRMVDDQFLPLGVLALMKRKAVRWSMAL